MLLLLVIMLIVVSGCIRVEDRAGRKEIKGKFVFYSSRDIERVGHWGIFTWDNARVKKVIDSGGSPQWSNDGERIACVQGDLIIAVYAKNGKFIQNYPLTKGANSITWSPDNMKFVYTMRGALGKKVAMTDALYLYDTLTSKKTKLLDFEGKNSIGRISFSPEGDKVLFQKIDRNDMKNDGIYFYNLEDGVIKLIIGPGSHPTWFPAGKHILVATNRKDDWSMINDKLGVFMKINIETGERIILGDKDMFLWSLELSKDGKYVYYTKEVRDKGKAIFVAPLNNLEEEIQVTYPPTVISRRKAQDTYPDWYQKIGK